MREGERARSEKCEMMDGVGHNKADFSLAGSCTWFWVLHS